MRLNVSGLSIFQHDGTPCHDGTTCHDGTPCHFALRGESFWVINSVINALEEVDQ